TNLRECVFFPKKKPNAVRPGLYAENISLLWPYVLPLQDRIVGNNLDGITLVVDQVQCVAVVVHLCRCQAFVESFFIARESANGTQIPHGAVVVPYRPAR